MNDLTIQEGNKLIAEFMGLTPNKHDNGKTYGISPVEINGTMYAEKWIKPNYHSSWDALMPVVEKIENTKTETLFANFFAFTVRINRNYCCILCHERGKQDGVIYQTPYGYEPKNKIDAVWLAVVDFIQWYNKEHKAQVSDTTEAKQ